MHLPDKREKYSPRPPTGLKYRVKTAPGGGLFVCMFNLYDTCTKNKIKYVTFNESEFRKQIL